MPNTLRRLAPILALTVSAIALSGCAYDHDDGYYHHRYNYRGGDYFDSSYAYRYRDNDNRYRYRHRHDRDCRYERDRCDWNRDDDDEDDD